MEDSAGSGEWYRGPSDGCLSYEDEDEEDVGYLSYTELGAGSNGEPKRLDSPLETETGVCGYPYPP